MTALQVGQSLTDTPRGPIKFDHFGNVIGDFYIRRSARKAPNTVSSSGTRP